MYVVTLNVQHGIALLTYFGLYTMYLYEQLCDDRSTLLDVIVVDRQNLDRSKLNKEISYYSVNKKNDCKKNRKSV